MIDKVLSFVKKYHMIEQGEHILAGVSGGADSVCLLLVLETLRNQYDCKITVVHVEHGIRGISSMADAAFVKALCEEKNIPCRIFHCDAVAYADERGMSLEEGARELRYDFFRQTGLEVGADKIAVAHNQNDSAETLLFHLARGTGLRGMCGIAPIRDNIIRPLLCVDRKSIEAFLEEQGQDYCTDITNFETEYSRNKIRHQVLPVLENVNSRAVAHMYRSTEYVWEAVSLLDELVQQAESSCVEMRKTEREMVVAESQAAGIETTTSHYYFIRDSIMCQRPLIQKMLILKLMGACAGSEKDISDVHVTQILKLFDGQVGKYVMLPYQMEARRNYDGVTIRKVEKAGGKGTAEQNKVQEMPVTQKMSVTLDTSTKWQVKPDTTMELSEYGWLISTRIIDKRVKKQEIPKKAYTKWFDYDKIKGTLLLRKRCQGDYIIIDSKGGKQSLKKYFINEKVLAAERDRVLLLADEAHVLWIVGHRISEEYKVTEDTKRILEIQISGGNINE